MGSGYSIIWADSALDELNSILKYLEENWSEKEIVNFVRKLDKRLNLISLYPKLYPLSKQK